MGSPSIMDGGEASVLLWGVRLGCSAGDLGISGVPQAPAGPVWVWPLAGPAVCPSLSPAGGWWVPTVASHCLPHREKSSI